MVKSVSTCWYNLKCFSTSLKGLRFLYSGFCWCLFLLLACCYMFSFILSKWRIRSCESFWPDVLHELVDEDRPAVRFLHIGDITDCCCEIVDHVPQIDVYLMRFLGQLTNILHEKAVKRHDWLEIDSPKFLSYFVIQADFFLANKIKFVQFRESLFVELLAFLQFVFQFGNKFIEVIWIGTPMLMKIRTSNS